MDTEFIKWLLELAATDQGRSAVTTIALVGFVYYVGRFVWWAFNKFYERIVIKDNDAKAATSELDEFKTKVLAMLEERERQCQEDLKIAVNMNTRLMDKLFKRNQLSKDDVDEISQDCPAYLR